MQNILIFNVNQNSLEVVCLCNVQGQIQVQPGPRECCKCVPAVTSMYISYILSYRLML